MRTDLFINNEWRPAASGRRFPVVNPATEEVIAEVALGDAADVDAAVKGARACFESDGWRKLSARQRGRLLAKTADLLEARLDEFARLETAHNGKTLFESKIELGMTVNTLRYYAGWADKIVGDTLPVEGPFFVYTLREPIGVVGAIVPWNFPLNIASWKFAPALAAGCTVVLKPASETPLTALLFAELVQEAGFPAGAFNVVAGGGSTAGAALVRHAGVDKIAFTGSTEVGRQIMKMAADTNKRVTLELGGKSPNIVFADADVKAAVRGAQTGIFYGKGEVCAAGSRLFLEDSIHDAFMSKLTERVKGLTVGDPMDKATRMGPVVSKAQMDTVLSYIEAGKQEGARLVTGGGRATVGNGKGYFIQPTIFDDVRNTMKIAREEIFGPVLSVIPFKSLEEGLAEGNATSYGLAAAVWTRDVAKALRAAQVIRAGTVWVNAYNLFDAALPFGGFKESGFGREMGAAGLEHYTEVKTVWVDLS